MAVKAAWPGVSMKVTGTPPGVGCFRKPQLWLHPGDVVTVEIEKLGSITNTV
jgi:2-keto-4-pentenoate hydratase/2-oxohepta-3-ene-1,7-dioic acid hydratase in catechol pathway